MRWILGKDPKLVFLCKPFMIGYKIENKYFYWIILSGREEGKDFGSNREGLSAFPKILLNPVNLPTHQPAVYQLRLPREHLTLYVPCTLPCLRLPCTRARGRTLVRTIAPRFSKYRAWQMYV